MARESKKNIHRAALAFALLIGAVLALAAWGKIFYPAELIKVLDRWVGVFEIIFLLIILAFKKRAPLWLGAALVFAGWGGYAIYWHCVQLPCNCMGSMLDIPTCLSITTDVVFCVGALVFGCLLGAKRMWVEATALSCLMAALIGFACADWIYLNLVLVR